MKVCQLSRAPVVSRWVRDRCLGKARLLRRATSSTQSSLLTCLKLDRLFYKWPLSLLSTWPPLTSTDLQTNDFQKGKRKYPTHSNLTFRLLSFPFTQLIFQKKQASSSSLAEEAAGSQLRNGERRSERQWAGRRRSPHPRPDHRLPLWRHQLSHLQVPGQGLESGNMTTGKTMDVLSNVSILQTFGAILLTADRVLTCYMAMKRTELLGQHFPAPPWVVYTHDGLMVKESLVRQKMLKS